MRKAVLNSTLADMFSGLNLTRSDIAEILGVSRMTTYNYDKKGIAPLKLFILEEMMKRDPTTYGAMDNDQLREELAYTIKARARGYKRKTQPETLARQLDAALAGKLRK